MKVGRKFVTRCTITGCFALAVLVSGCAKKKPATAADYYGSLDYQNRALLQQSLFRSDEERLSNAEIETILSSRIQLPQSAHLTILRLGAIDETLSWAFPTEADPFALLAATPRLARVSWLPSLLVPEKLNVPALREAAARFQADLLMVYRTPCQRFQNYRLFGDDRARTYCVAEGLLLDVRTGIIPFSTAVAREVEVREERGDVNFYETLRKAEASATAEALAELSRELAEFLAAAP